MSETTKSPNLLEDQQIYTAAAMFIAANQVLNKTLQTEDIMAFLKPLSDDSDDRLFVAIMDYRYHIDQLVQDIFDATITP